MKIAAITMTYNDGYKFKEWCRWYEEIKEEIDLHIIVDNGSESGYVRMIKDYFKDSIIIERDFNGGCTAAYNDGISCALKDLQVDAIFILGNDVRYEKGSIKKLYEYLYSDDNIGIVGPIMLYKDSEVIQDYGVTFRMINSKFNYSGQVFSNKLPDMIVDSIPGGATMAKREFYIKTGLQDEKLFMYQDERETTYKARRYGFKVGVTARAKAWHQHIVNPNITQSVNSKYLIARNMVYLDKKYQSYSFLWIHIVMTFLVNTLVCIKSIGNATNRFQYKEYLKGIKAGLKDNMSNENIW